MPATELALARTDAYRAQLLVDRTRVTQAAAQAWTRTVTLDDLDGSFAAWLALAAAAATAAQRRGVAATERYLADFLSAELGRPQRTVPTALDDLPGRGEDGRTWPQLLRGSVIGVRLGLQHGRPAGQALQMGLARANLTIGMEVISPSRAALDRLVADDDRIGDWRRVCSSNACGACLGAATGALTSKIGRRLRVHPHCRCTKEYRVRGVRERFLRPTGQQIFDAKTPAQQDALFHGRGGAEKAELIRSGEASLSDLVTSTPMARVAHQITETPLAALRG